VGPFSIQGRDAGSAARAGTLSTAHGDILTPAFVPLATKATVKGLLPGEVADLGYRMVFANTFHLLLNPGPELVAHFGGLHRFMGWEHPIITDSGGFQVFSMGHGRVSEEIKGSNRRRPAAHADRAGRADEAGHGDDAGRAEGAGHADDAGHAEGAGRADDAGHAEGARRAEGAGGVNGTARSEGGHSGAVLAISEEGVRFRSYVDGREIILTPESSMATQAALGSDIALVFDECTPYHVDRDYTERSTERTHRWLQRCLDWHGEHGPDRQLVYGISQGGVYEDLRRASTRTVARSGADGVAIGGSLGATKAQMYGVVATALAELGGEHETLPRHLLGVGEIDDLIAGVKLGVDTFDCAMPTRLGRHGSALVTDAEQEPGAPGGRRRWRIDLGKRHWRNDERPLREGCACPACSTGLSRAYLSYLVAAKELTAVRLLSAHNLAFVASLMTDMRAGILAGRLAEVVDAWEQGRPELAAAAVGSRSGRQAHLTGDGAV
jgi:queuine tRNA-ribosyltransferase